MHIAARMGHACLIMLLLLFVRGAAAESNVGAAEAIRIVCLGDSVTRAVRPGVTAEQTFCALLQDDLVSRGLSVDVINAGVGGSTTTSGLQRFDSDVLAKSPQYVVIMFGLNDSWIDDGKTTSRVSLADYRANLQRMVSLLRERKIAVVLMTSNPAIAPKFPPERNRTLKPYIATVRAVGQAEQVPVIDVYARFAELAIEGMDVNTLFTDAMHPNPAGQEVIAGMLIEHFAPRLAK
jgi:lysophospholipase L1-like esterase